MLTKYSLTHIIILDSTEEQSPDGEGHGPHQQADMDGAGGHVSAGTWFLSFFILVGLNLLINN